MSKPSTDIAEGRAVLARPSACLLLVASMLLVAALLASTAQAKPTLLVLTKTDPDSAASAPANSTTPRVFGVEDSVITTAIGPLRESGFPISSAADPADVEVSIYTNSSCAGTPRETGSLEQLEVDGIQVEVAPDAATTFYATQTDPTSPGEPSDCSTPGLTYWEGSVVVTPPSEPPPGGSGGPGGPVAPAEPAGGGAGGSGTIPDAPRLRILPAGRANDNTPLVAGDAPGAGTVRIFSTANCKGSPAASGTAAELAAGLPVQMADNTTTTFSGLAVSGGNQSPCSTPVTYVEDSTAPRTRITMGPGVKTRKRNAVFRFADTTEDPAGTLFLCKVDHRKWKQCNSPFKLRRLGFSRHTLRVRAVDSAGNAEAKGTKRRFKVIHGT